jgi:carboxyl-terminal processing protease
MKAKLIFVAMLSGLLLVCASQAQESVTGVGIALGVENHTLKIMKVLPNTPASKAGLSSGLVVQKIDGTVTDGKHLKNYVDMLRGAAGTKVKLELVDTANSKTNTVELIRERIL